MAWRAPAFRLMNERHFHPFTDFGASRIQQDNDMSNCMNSLQGSVFWLAPEVLSDKGYGLKAGGFQDLMSA